MTSNEAILEAKGLCFTRNGRHILKDISCEMQAGSLTVLLGPNGAGKSTLLKLLSGDCQPDRGTVHLRERSLADWTRKELAFERAVLPQESKLNFPFRVEEVVAMGRCPHYGQCSRSEDNRICQWALNEMGLKKLCKSNFTVLSGGEKQRVQFARVLAQLGPERKANGSTALFLDEPTSSLDLHHQRHLLKHARSLADEGVAVLAILHDLNLAMSIADRVWLMRDGELVADGPTEEVLQPRQIEEVFNVQVKAWREENTSRPLLAVVS